MCEVDANSTARQPIIFLFNDPATTEIYTLSLHDALPISVLSLQALPRRIALDFRDVFSDGFAFDTITATADIRAGVLTSSDFRMRGPNATVLLDGSTVLRNEMQNLR